MRERGGVVEHERDAAAAALLAALAVADDVAGDQVHVAVLVAQVRGAVLRARRPVAHDRQAWRVVCVSFGR